MEYVYAVQEFIAKYPVPTFLVFIGGFLTFIIVNEILERWFPLANSGEETREQDMEKFVAFGGGQHIGKPTTLEKCYEWAGNCLATKTTNLKIYICEVKEVVTYAVPPISRTAFVPVEPGNEAKMADVRHSGDY